MLPETFIGAFILFYIILHVRTVQYVTYFPERLHRGDRFEFWRAGVTSPM